MCILEYIAYTCGHRSISVLRACPMTTHLHTNPVCPVASTSTTTNDAFPSASDDLSHCDGTTQDCQDTGCCNTTNIKNDTEYTGTRISTTERAFFAKTMCSPCGRIMHANWVNIMEYEHRWMHERGVCGCPVKFPALMGPRVVGAGCLTNREHEGGDHSCDGQRGPENDLSMERKDGVAPLFEQHENSERHRSDRLSHDNEKCDADDSQDPSFQVSVRLPSLYAAEWVNDHRVRHDTGQCQCLVSFDQYQPTAFGDHDQDNGNKADLEEFGCSVEDGNGSEPTPSAEYHGSSGKEQRDRSDKNYHINSHQEDETGVEDLQDEDRAPVEYFVPFRCRSTRTREPSEASSSPPAAPRKPRRTTSLHELRQVHGSRRKCVSPLKNHEADVDSSALSTPLPSSTASLSEQCRDKTSREDQTLYFQTPPQPIPSDLSKQECNNNSPYFMERILGPAELIQPVPYDETLVPYTSANYTSSSSDGFVKGVTKPSKDGHYGSTGDYHSKLRGKRGRAKAVLKSPYNPSGNTQLREDQSRVYAHYQQVPHHQLERDSRHLPIAGFPIGAGAENDSHAGDYECCRLRRHAYSLSHEA